MSHFHELQLVHDDVGYLKVSYQYRQLNKLSREGGCLTARRVSVLIRL